MGLLKVYNADEVSIIIGPVIIESGYADGEFFTLEGEADDTEDVAGTDGEVAVSRTNDRRATAMIKLMQTADKNDELSILSKLTRTAPGMLGGIVPFRVRDQNGRALWTAENCWVQRPPDVSLDRTAQTREWTIRIANLVRFDGGN